LVFCANKNLATLQYSLRSKSCGSGDRVTGFSLITYVCKSIFRIFPDFFLVLPDLPDFRWSHMYVHMYIGLFTHSDRWTEMSHGTTHKK
jgi:hypothetical protein